VTPTPGNSFTSGIEALDTGEHHGPSRVTVAFDPSGKSVRVPAGVSVFDAASWNGIAIDSTCGGHGTCKKCIVQILAGDVEVSRLDERALDSDRIAQGWRLACLAKATGDLKVEVPPLTTRPKAATVGVGRQVILRPAIQKRYIELEEPSLHDQRTDLVRVLDAIDDFDLVVEPAVLATLGRDLRAGGWNVTAVIVDDQLIGVEPGDTTGAAYGIAIDLGTTTVVANLMDVATGTPVAVKSMLNKQQPFGADVISRISATMLDPQSLPRLQELAQDTLRELVAEACEEGGIDPTHVYEVTLAGNATMVQLLLGIDPEPLGVAPFIMAAASYPNLRASDFGLSLHPAARAEVLPALGAYVGGDIVAGALASGMDRDKRLRLFIDVGTNCEIVLGDGERMMATAAPAGPAFEAASIRNGMRAAPGAIETVTIDDSGISVGVIGDVAAVGLCGSGLVDAVAELVRVGLVDGSGRFVSAEQAAELRPDLAARLIDQGGERWFELATEAETGGDAVVLTQRDIRELQFAKAAISTGWRLLLEEFGATEQDVQQVLLAGSFGTYLSPKNAVSIGLVPKLPVMRIVSAGNVAGEGAKMILLSLPERHGAMSLLDEIEYMELSDRTDFNDRFVDELAFPV